MDRLELPIAGLLCSIVGSNVRPEKAAPVPVLPTVRVVKEGNRRHHIRARLAGLARSIRWAGSPRWR